MGGVGLIKMKRESKPRPPNVALLRALWSLLDGIWGVLKGSWGVMEDWFEGPSCFFFFKPFLLLQ